MPERHLAPVRVSRRRWQATLVLSLTMWRAATLAQDVTEPSLKAAFIYSFAKFTEWPTDALAATKPFVACVVGDEQTGDALERAVKGRSLTGHPVIVEKVPVSGSLRSCHLLYVSNLVPSQAAQVITSIRTLPVLTISDMDDFMRLGGIAQVFVENGKMRFDMNYALAKRNHLQLSSKLLSLASNVLDEPSGSGR